MDNKTLMMWRPGIGDLVAPAESPAGTIYDIYGKYNVSATSTTRDGFRVVRSADYYLNTICTQDPNPAKYGTYYGYFEGFYYYDKDPVLGQVNETAGGRPELVIGGKARQCPLLIQKGTRVLISLWEIANVRAGTQKRRAVFGYPPEH